MYKTTLHYKTFDGKPVEREVYFNLSKPEAVLLELEYEDGMSAEIERLVGEEDKRGMVILFEKLIRESYGNKSDDGEIFLKDPITTQEFMQSAAYEELFMHILTDEKVATLFVKSVIPSMGDPRLDNPPPKPKVRRG